MRWPSFFRPRFFVALAAASAVAFIGVLFASQHPLFISNGTQSAAVAADASPELTSMLGWIIAGGYIVIFFGMMTEGPIVTAAAAFAASLGYLNVWAVLLLAVLADLTADTSFYLLGHFTRAGVLEKRGSRIGFTPERLKKLEHLLHTHPIKTILALKLIPGAAVVGLPLVGVARVPIHKYFSICLAFIFPSALLFTSLGYFFGRAYVTITAYLQHAEYFMLFAVVALLGVYYLYKKVTAYLASRLEPI